MQKIKSNLFFASMGKIKSTRKLNIKYKNIKKKQLSQVAYLDCAFNETLSGKPMALKTWNKLNGKPIFYRKNNFRTPTLCKILCNALIQSYFDYSYSAWYPNLNEKLKKYKSHKNKCISFCLKLDKGHLSIYPACIQHISNEELQSINWLLVYKRLH